MTRHDRAWAAGDRVRIFAPTMKMHGKTGTVEFDASDPDGVLIVRGDDRKRYALATSEADPLDE